jgi:palmitoyl-protein thioesterase
MHGFSFTSNSGTAHDWDAVKGWVSQYHPGTAFYALATFEGITSSRPMTEQMLAIQALIEKIVSSNPGFENGYHLLGHSQGGLMMRVMTESINNHSIDTLISLAGVQNGIYGLAMLANKFGNLTDVAATKLFYTKILQDEFSGANYWHSPLNGQLPYQTHCAFLPYVNNVVQSSNSARHKTNFMRLRKAVFFSSPADGFVQPYESELFGFFATNSESQRIPMQQQDFYINDSFGLKSMMQAGKIILKSVDGIAHANWLRDKQNFVANVLPFLV